MIEWLRGTKSGNFYRRQKRIPRRAITELFRDLRQEAKNPSNNLFQHVKEPLDDSVWSALAFYYERMPVFLEAPQNYPGERICGFVLLIERHEYVSIFKSQFEIPPDFKSTYLTRAGDDNVEAAIASADATFEQIRLRSMATSKFALRSKTLEADDLEPVVAPLGSSRFVPKGFRVKLAEDRYSATPSTGRISLRSDRVSHEDLIRWAALVIDKFDDPNATTSTFIRTFARPISLETLPPEVVPEFMGIDAPSLAEALFDEEHPKVLLQHGDDGERALTVTEVQDVLTTLGNTFPIRKVWNEYRLLREANGKRIGTLAIGKTRISLRQFEIPETTLLSVATPGDGDARRPIPLKRYIDQNDWFTVLFSDPTVAYLNGTLFRDEALTNGESFLAPIRGHARLNDAESEKGEFTPAQTRFDATSIFGFIVDHLAQLDRDLICDDLGDEWADFIGINTEAQPRTITFYHAKHGETTLGAGALHIVVSQAIKNLGRMNLKADVVTAKVQTWRTTYNAEDVRTQIERIVRGNADGLADALNSTLRSPDTIKRVFIVTSSLSRQELETHFQQIRAGGKTRPYFVQLYWLLMSYFSACTEVGAFGYVICKP